MLFLEVSGLDPVLLSSVAGRQEVPQHIGGDGGHHGDSLGPGWGL